MVKQCDFQSFFELGGLRDRCLQRFRIFELLSGDFRQVYGCLLEVISRWWAIEANGTKRRISNRCNKGERSKWIIEATKGSNRAEQSSWAIEATESNRWFSLLDQQRWVVDVRGSNVLKRLSKVPFECAQSLSNFESQSVIQRESQNALEDKFNVQAHVLKHNNLYESPSTSRDRSRCL